MLGGEGVWSPAPRDRARSTDLDDGSPYPVITGDYASGRRVWASTPARAVGTPLAPPTPVFTKLDESIVAEELARLEEEPEGCPARP